MPNSFLDLAKCASCGIKESRDRMCLQQIPPQNNREIAIVSQAPIMADVVANDAFDSRGGRLVRGLLENLGISRDSWYGTYAVACVPKDSGRPPQNAIEACRDRLKAELNHVHPRVIVAMGEIAQQALSRSRAATSTQRGMPYWHAELQAYVIPTHHPRFAMEQPSAFYEVSDDFAKIPKVLKWQPGKSVERPKTVHHTITDESKAIEACLYMRQNASWIASDVETKGFNWKRDKIICAGFSWRPGTTIIFDKNIIESPKVHPYLKDLLTDPNIEWIWHNGKFDIKFWRWQHNIQARIDFDTMLAHYVLNERRGTHDLEQIAVELIYAEPWEHHLDRYKKLPTFEDYESIPKPVLHEYLGKDVDYTGRVRLEELDRFAEERTRRDVDGLFDMLIQGAESFTEIEMNGIHADKDYTKELVEYFTPRLEGHVQTLQEYATSLGWDPTEYAKWWTNTAMQQYIKDPGKKKKPPNPTKPPKEFNPNSHQQLKYTMYQLMRLPLYKREMTSNKEARKWYMENCEMEIPFIARLDEFKKESKLFTTYVEGINELVWDIDSSIHPTFNLHGTETGRLSSSEPNVQNIPRDSKIKNIFIAQPDDSFGEFILLQADYSQAELRVLAVLGGSPWLQGVYYRGEDLHDAVSIQLYGKNFTKEQRVRAKAVNFGIPYGRTEYTLADEHKMRVNDARKLIQDWFAPQPETKTFMDTRRQEPLDGIVYVSPTARMRSYGLITEVNKRAIMNEAGNFPIQGTASDLTLTSVNRIVPAFKHYDQWISDYRVQHMKVVNSVHDSIIAQVRIPSLRIAAKIMDDIMCSVPGELLKTDMPFKADFEIGFRWGSLKGYDYKTETVTWEDKDSEGNKVPRQCEAELFIRYRGDTKRIVSEGLVK